MKKYSVLIIDLKKSREYVPADRMDIQIYIKNVIWVLNKMFVGELEREVVFSAGDEVQGLFASPQSAYLYFRLFNMLISPVEIRAGIGVGEWNIKIENTTSTEQDGSAYHNARYAIDSIEDSLGDFILLFSGGKSDIYINSVINTATVLANNQSEYQNGLYLLTELMYPIDINGVIDFNFLNEVSGLLKQKSQLSYYTKWKASRGLKHNLLNIVPNCDFKVVTINAFEEETKFFVSSGRVKGLSRRLAEVFGTSRQNIEKSIKSGNIYQARNSTIVALKLMREYLEVE